jgi:transposase
VAAADGDREVRPYGSIDNTPQALRKLVGRLRRSGELHFAYEAGPCGYVTYRQLKALGMECPVVAPSRTPRKPADRIKNDRRDAITLARLHRAGELTAVWVPDEDTEAMRDLTRAREDAKYAQTRAKQRLGAFLLRHGRRYTGGYPWTYKHINWIREQVFDHPSQQVCLDEYLQTVEEASQRVKRLEQQVNALVPSWSQARVVQALTGLRGVKTLTAATVAAELGDLPRFQRPRDLMGFVGLVPSLDASGQRHHSGRITKTGNMHARRILTEAAWAYRFAARRSPDLMRRLKSQPQDVQQISWKAQLRLCGRYRKMRARGIPQQKVVTAVARELVGFMWAVARTVSEN